MPERRKNRHGLPEWYAVLKADGKRKFKKCASKDDAVMLEIQHRRRAEAFNLTPEVVALNGLLLNYTAAIEARGISRMSVMEKAHVFKEFALAIGGGRPVESITYGEVERYLAGVAQRVSGSRANRHRVHIVAAYNWGMKAMRLPSPNPWEVEKFREDKHPRYVPPVEDFWKIVDAAKNDHDPQAQRLILAYLYTSARKSELFNLQWSDVDFKGGTVRLWTRKRSGGLESDLVPMSAELEVILAEQRKYIELRSEYVFPNPETRTRYAEHGKLMKRLCSQAGTKPFGFHAIRHLSASVLADARLSLPVIQAMLRHKDLKTTSRYIHTLRGVKAELMGVFARKEKGQPRVKLE